MNFLKLTVKLYIKETLMNHDLKRTDLLIRIIMGSHLYGA